MAGSKYDITSGLAEYESLYYDVGVDKYIEGVKSLKDTYDKNVAGTSLIKEAAAKMDFMPNDEYARTYLEEGVNNILESAMEAPETATSQVNKAMQFFTSDPKLSQFRRNAAEFNKTEQIALNTPGGWSSMIMFGQNPMDFKTENEDGSLNVYQHTSEQRLDQSGSFLQMVGQIAMEAGATGAMYEDIDADGIYDILANKTWKGVTNKRADEIVNGIMEQFITGSSEGVQALRELMEPVGGKPPVTTDREEAKRLLYERMRPLVQNQVGMQYGESSAQITGASSQKVKSLEGAMPSLLLEILKGDVKEVNNQQLTSLGIKKDAFFNTDQAMVTDYASAIDLGFLNQVDNDYAIGDWKPFEGLEGNQKATRTLQLLEVLRLSAEGSDEEAAQFALKIPGFKEALQAESDQTGPDVFESLRELQTKTSALSLDEQQKSLGVLFNMSLSGAVMTPGPNARVKTVNRGGQAVVAVEVKGFISAETLGARAQQQGVGKPGIQLFSFLPRKVVGNMEPAFWTPDVDELKHPATGELLFEKDKYNGVDGYYFTTWVEHDANITLQEQIDQSRVGVGTGSIEDNNAAMKAQIEERNKYIQYFQEHKNAYQQSGIIMYGRDKTLEGTYTPKIYNARQHVKKDSVLDIKINDLFDLMPDAAVSTAMSTGVNLYDFEASVNTQLMMIIASKKPDKWKEKEVQKIINYVQSINYR